MATNPNDILEPPEQFETDQPAPISQESLIRQREEEEKKKRKDALAKVNMTPSEDLDLSDVKKKPQPRDPKDPSFRGWKEVGQWDAQDVLTAEDESVDLLMKQSVFDTYLPSIAFGDWYHNVGYLSAGALLSWIVGWLKFSIAPVFFIMLIFSILYRSSVRKYRTSLRDLAQREFSIKTIENDYETMDWLNVFLEKFWFFLEPSISQIVCEQVNPILASSPAPAIIKALWIDSFTAGTKPPRITAVKTIGGTSGDVVVMDWGFSFTPNTLADANSKQLRSKVNQKTVVKASIFGFPITVAVSDVSVNALARVRLRMMTSFPHIETINLSLLEPPQIDFNCRLLGDSVFNWEVLGFPGLYPLINEMIKKYAGPMLYNPLSFQLNVQQLMEGFALDSAIGVLAITSYSARGLKAINTIGNTLDPYLSFSFKGVQEGKTKVISNTSRPSWNETTFVVVKSLSEPLNISCFDYNDFRKDREVGAIKFDLEALRDDQKQSNLTAAFVRNNKAVGELQFGLHFMPTIPAKKQVDGAVIPPPDLNTGIVRLEIAEARHLSDGDKPANTYAELFLNNEKILTTKLQKKNNAPGWAEAKEIIINNRAKSKVKVVLRNKSDKILGKVNGTLDEFIDATQVEQPWFPLAHGGEIRINTSWKPVAMEGASGSTGYTPPIGVVRVSIHKADDLRNLESIGKIDPYARLLINGFQRARTATVESSLNPTWNEIHYISVSSANQKLTIDVMDVENFSADRTLGAFDVKLNEIINKNESGKYIEYIDDRIRESKLIHKKGPKGTVSYSLSFYPTLPVMTVQDIRDEEEEKERAKHKREHAAKEKKEKDDSKKDAVVSNDEPEEMEDDEDDDINSNKLRLSLDELLEYNSGTLSFEFTDVEVSKDDVYLQVFFDNHGHNDFVSQKLKNKKSKINTTGDCIIKELDWSKANLRIVKKEDENRAETPLAEVNIPTMQLLKNGYDSPTTVKLSGSCNATVTLQCSWIPILYESGLPTQDSYSNSGNLHVDIIGAEGLTSADRNGKSDPYIKLYLNTANEDFYKTKKIKRTLDPTWNESTSVEVANKFDSVIKVVCYDWDIGPEKDDLLGVGYINLSEVELNESTDFDVQLILNNAEAGVAHFKCSFKPDFVLNVKPKSSTHIGDAFGTVGNVGMGVGKGVGHVGAGVGKGVGKGLGGGVKAFKKGLHLGKSSE